MKKVWMVLSVTLLVSTLWTLQATAAQTKGSSNEIVIKAISYIPYNMTGAFPFRMYVDRVNKLGKGKVSIKVAGGPEVMRNFEQPMAVKEGLFDMAYATPSFYPSIVPGGITLQFSELSFLEEIETGAIDFYREQHKKGGLFFVGRVGTSHLGGLSNWQFMTNKLTKTPKDLVGQKIGYGTIVPAFVQAVGAINVTITAGDCYTALERGVIEGMFHGIEAAVARKWYEKFKYVIEPSYYQRSNIVIMNLASWEKLPIDIQNFLIDTVNEVAKEAADIMEKYSREGRKTIQEAGVKFIRFSPDEEAKLIALSKETGWNDLIKEFPDVGPLYKKWFSKAGN